MRYARVRPANSSKALYCAWATRIHFARLTDSYLPANLCLIYSPVILPRRPVQRRAITPPRDRIPTFHSSSANTACLIIIAIVLSFRTRAEPFVPGRLQVERATGRSHSVTALLFAIETQRVPDIYSFRARSRSNQDSVKFSKTRLFFSVLNSSLKS